MDMPQMDAEIVYQAVYASPGNLGIVTHKMIIFKYIHMIQGCFHFSGCMWKFNEVHLLYYIYCTHQNKVRKLFVSARVEVLTRQYNSTKQVMGTFDRGPTRLLRNLSGNEMCFSNFLRFIQF